jgi:hypothetical protein
MLTQVKKSSVSKSILILCWSREIIFVNYNAIRPHRHLNGLTPDEQWNAVNPYEMLPKRIKKVSLWNGLLKGYTLDYK